MQFSLRPLALALTLGAALSSAAPADEIKVDFGLWSPDPTPDWNTARTISRTGSIVLKNSAGGSPGYTLFITKGFTEPHSLGNPSPTGVLGLPAFAVKDSLYGNTVQGTVSGQTTYWSPNATLEVRGLNPTIAYSFQFYAFVNQNDGVNRTALYTVRGATTSSASFNPTMNSTLFASIPNIKPSASGIITIDVSKGPGNNSSAGFYHLSSFRMTYSLVATTNPPPTVSAGSAKTLTLAAGATTTSTSLTGTASDADGIDSTKWTQTGGAAGPVIAAPAALTTAISGLKVGTYAFTLTATDKKGATASKSVSVTVNAAGTTTFTACAPYSGFPATLKICAKGVRPEPYGFIEYLPTNYSTGSGFPLVVFLHGIGERGTGALSDVARIGNFGPMGQVKNKARNFPFVAIAPQEDPSQAYWNVDNLNLLIEHAKKAYKIDPARIHLTGLSFGGGGTVAYANKYPTQIASMAPVSTGYLTTSGAQAIVNEGIAIWGTHAINDQTVNYVNTVKPFIDKVASLKGLPSPFANYPASANQMTCYYDPTLKKWVWRTGTDYKTLAGVAPQDPLSFSLFTGGDPKYAHNSWFLYEGTAFYDWIMLHHR